MFIELAPSPGMTNVIEVGWKVFYANSISLERNSEVDDVDVDHDGDDDGDDYDDDVDDKTIFQVKNDGLEMEEIWLRIYAPFWALTQESIHSFGVSFLLDLSMKK